MLSSAPSIRDVEADLAELIDQNQRVGQRLVLEQAVEQRRLAGAEKAGEQGQRDGQAALQT